MRKRFSVITMIAAVSMTLAVGNDEHDGARRPQSIREIQVHHPATTGFKSVVREEGPRREIVILEGVPFHFDWSVFDPDPIIRTQTRNGEAILTITLTDEEEELCCTSCNDPHVSPYYLNIQVENCFAGGGNCQWCTVDCGPFVGCDDPEPGQPGPPKHPQQSDTVEQPHRERIGRTLHVNRDLRFKYQRNDSP